MVMISIGRLLDFGKLFKRFKGIIWNKELESFIAEDSEVAVLLKLGYGFAASAKLMEFLL